MKKYNVVIVDDHLLFAQSLKGLIDTFEEYNVIYHALNGKDLIEKLDTYSNKPDVILMDVNMPVMNGIETTYWLKKNRPEIKVMALSMDDEETLILKMIKKGAKGYLLKDIHPNELHTALNEVIEDGFYHSKRVSKTLQKSLASEIKEAEEISENEMMVLKMACTEKTYKEMAEEMYLSPKTIDGYRDSLFKKTGAKSRIGLVIYALKNSHYEI